MNQGVYVIVRDKMAQQRASRKPFVAAPDALCALTSEWESLQASLSRHDLDAAQNGCFELAASVLRLAEKLFTTQRARRRAAAKEHG